MTAETFSDSVAAGIAPDHPSLAARNKLVINILLASTFVVMLNETAMSVAIPRLMEALSVPASAAQWLTTAFLLTMAVVIPVTGFLLQRMNTRPVFMLAMSLFALGTLIACVAPGLPVLVIGRVVQAAGTAVMMPLLMTTTMTLVPPNERGKMMGRISIVFSVAPALGPAIAGVVLNYFEWRMLFVVMLPFALAALALGQRRMVNISTPRFAPLDIVSVVMSAIAFGGIVYGLSNLGLEDQGGIPAWIPLVVGAVVMVVFVLRQIQLQRKDAALLDLRTLKVANFTISMTMIAMLMLAMFGVIILLPIYLVQIQGFNVLQTGLLLMPGALLQGLLGPWVGRIFDARGPRPMIILAMVVVVIVLWALTLVGVGTPWPYIMAGHIVMSVAFAFLFGPLFTTSLGSVPPNLYGHGSAVLGSVQQVAGAAGVALFVAIMTAQSASLAAGGLPPSDALAGGIRMAFFVGAILAFLPLVASFFVQRAPMREHGGHGGH